MRENAFARVSRRFIDGRSLQYVRTLVRGSPRKGRPLEGAWGGERRTNETHQGTTDPDARLYR
jgi:hypothetical protein